MSSAIGSLRNTHAIRMFCVYSGEHYSLNAWNLAAAQPFVDPSNQTPSMHSQIHQQAMQQQFCNQQILIPRALNPVNLSFSLPQEQKQAKEDVVRSRLTFTLI